MSIQLQSVSSTIDGPAVRDRVKTLLGGTGVARRGRVKTVVPPVRTRE